MKELSRQGRDETNKKYMYIVWREYTNEMINKRISCDNNLSDILAGTNDITKPLVIDVKSVGFLTRRETAP